jgi:hypothetical protein
MSEVIFLSNVRLSFPHLAEPQRTENPTRAPFVSRTTRTS